MKQQKSVAFFGGMNCGFVRNKISFSQLDVPVGWRAETTQVTHEEQNLLERLCGLGLGYFKYSANILSAVS